MIDSNPAAARSGRAFLPPLLAVPLALVLVAIFIALLFPWDSVARRLTHEIARASGGEISIQELAPAFTARGPVLAARNVLVVHPAIDRVRIEILELAPRWSTSWLRGAPTLRIWASTELGQIDGVLQLGASSAFVGQVSEVEIEKLPLRLDAAGVQLSGRMGAQTDVALDPRGILTGRAEFESLSLIVESHLLPIAIPFTRASGVIEILESGATRIESVVLEGDVVEGTLDGEIAMVHHSQPPPIQLDVRIRIVDPQLRAMAPDAGIPISTSGEAALRVRGTLDAPEVESLGVPGAEAARSTRRR